MKAQRTALATIAAVVLLSAATGAQWVNRDAGDSAPADGKPNLTAPGRRGWRMATRTCRASGMSGT